MHATNHADAQQLAEQTRKKTCSTDLLDDDGETVLYDDDDAQVPAFADYEREEVRAARACACLRDSLATPCLARRRVQRTRARTSSPSYAAAPTTADLPEAAGRDTPGAARCTRR